MASNREVLSALATGPNLSLVEVMEKGLPLRSLEELRSKGYTTGELDDLVVSTRTMKRRQSSKQNLSAEESDRAFRLAKITELADRVFGNPAKAMHWLRHSNKRINGRAPLELLKTEMGGDLVQEMLYQIQEGMYV